MRIDHHAYQRATRIAGFGFLVQVGIGLTLLIFGLVANDTAFVFGSIYVLIGLLAWLGLIVIFNQHKLERLEALEEDQLAAGQGETGSAFREVDEEVQVASRRLRLMHRWLMPGLSLVIVMALAIAAALLTLRLLAVNRGDVLFFHTPHIGWAIALALGFATIAFIFSRFVAGMAKQPAWQNLRGGASFMVGNALVTLALAVGLGFRFFGQEQVIYIIAIAIPILMSVIALEIILNFVLNLYRPRVPGETPRPAFDSKMLSLLAAPDNIVRTINDAINYQIGFEITESWGYRLFARSLGWLVLFGVVALVALNCIVIIEPHQQGIKLARGAMVGDVDGEGAASEFRGAVHNSGVMLKWPWPIQTAQVFDVSTIRTLPLTSTRLEDRDNRIHLWDDDLSGRFDRSVDQFIVGASAISENVSSRGIMRFIAPGIVDENVVPKEGVDDEADQSSTAGSVDSSGDGSVDQPPTTEKQRRVSRALSIIEAEIILQYSIRETADGRDGLLDYLYFSSDESLRRENLTQREHALRSLARREIAAYFSELNIDEILSEQRPKVSDALADRIQRRFDAEKTGIVVQLVSIPMLRPAKDVVGKFHELSLSNQVGLQIVEEASQQVARDLGRMIGDFDMLHPILAEIEEWQRLRDAADSPDAPEVIAQRVKVESMLFNAGGMAAQVIARAESNRWIELMEARSEASRLVGQIQAYRAAPELYRQRETMRVYSQVLPAVTKYVLAIDPERVNFDIDVTELSSFNLGQLAEEDLAGANEQ